MSATQKKKKQEKNKATFNTYPWVKEQFAMDN